MRWNTRRGDRRHPVTVMITFLIARGTFDATLNRISG